MEQFMITVIDLAASLGVMLYVLVALAALLETTLGIGLIVPGSVLVLLSGMSAATGSASLFLLIPAAAFGALIGDNINYYLGEKYGRKWVAQKKRILSARHFAEGERFFRTHGAKSVFLGRFVPVIKEVVPFVAGMVHMDRKRFMLYNALGAFGWAIEWVGLGYIFAYYLHKAKGLIIKIDIGFLVLILILMTYYIYTRRAVTK